VASRKPAKIIQVGAGASTAIIQRAAREAHCEPRVVCVDPYPTAFLTRLAASGDIELVTRPAQALAPDELADLGAGDLLFVDSTHTVKPGSEVNHIVLEVLPRLAPGVFVHFHDIRFPYDYSSMILKTDLFFWSESVLVHAFLAQNSHIRILVSFSMLHHERPSRLRELLPAYCRASFVDGLRIGTHEAGHFPTALYLETI
jgi:hypothetical protein